MDNFEMSAHVSFEFERKKKIIFEPTKENNWSLKLPMLENCALHNLQGHNFSRVW